MMKRQQILADFGEFAIRSEDIDEVLTEACRLVGEALGTGRAKVLEIQEDRQELLVRAGVGWAPGVVGRVRLPMDERSSESYAIEAAEPVISQDIAREERFDMPDFMKEAGVVALVNVPIFVPGRRPYGVLQVDATEPREFGDDEIQFLRTYAIILGPVIDRLHLVEERARANEASRKSEEQFRTLFQSTEEGLAIVEMIYADDGAITDMIFRQVNNAYELQTGIGDAVGRSIYDIVPGVEDYWIDIYKKVATTGESARLERYQQDVDMWFDVQFTRADEEGRFVAVVFNNTTERKRAEATLRESEDRQAFLLALGDAMRSQNSAEDVVETAAKLLGLKLNASRVAFGEFDDEQDLVHISRGWTADGAETHPETLRQSDFLGPLLDELRADVTVRFEDVGEPPYLRPDLEALAAIGVRAGLSVPLIDDGRLVLNLMVHNHAPYHWSDSEVALAQETASRTWAALQRARAEAGLRESEERFQQFAKASAAGLWIRDAEKLEMEFVSPAVGAIYGVEPEALLGDVKQWALMIVPEDRAAALEHLEAARRGETSIHQFRILRLSDGSFRWIRSTDFPLLNAKGMIERIGGIAEDVTETKKAVEHQSVLLAELQHRVRNIMAMIRSMAGRTAEGSVDVEDYRDRLEGRLMALARVQVLLTREANAGGSLRNVLESEVGALAHHPGQLEASGPEVMLPPKGVEVLTLAFHELTTNALKYGALATAAGRIRVTWTAVRKRDVPWLAVDWVEEGGPHKAPSARRGFGSELIEARIPYELGGVGRITIEPGGARCHMELPLKDGESILETDAPVSTVTYGGSLDMSGAPDLSGSVVLIVEDDYYTASDTAAALRGAGAEVLGPCPSEEATRQLLEHKSPTAVVLDLNLGGGGPRFEIARILRQRNIPFIFLTGYDPEVIPPELTDVPRLQKPVSLQEIVEAIAQLKTSRT